MSPTPPSLCSGRSKKENVGLDGRRGGSEHVTPGNWAAEALEKGTIYRASLEARVHILETITSAARDTFTPRSSVMYVRGDVSCDGVVQHRSVKRAATKFQSPVREANWETTYRLARLVKSAV